jgi:hypothetical protein
MTDLDNLDDPFDRSALSLDPERIVETIAMLERRINERFPKSSLNRLSHKLLGIAEQTKGHLDEIERPVLWLRAGSWLIAGLLILGAVAAIWAVVAAVPEGFGSALDAVQILEAGIQDVVFVAFGLVFLITAENRLRRREALAYIRELRAIAHIVDMHQLTKDPDRLLNPVNDTSSSPERTLSRVQLGRYLDYCSEMLSLTSKLAALYAERFNDAVILQAVDEVEALTTGLSSKIWQKIMMLDDSD